MEKTPRRRKRPQTEPMQKQPAQVKQERRQYVAEADPQPRRTREDTPHPRCGAVVSKTTSRSRSHSHRFKWWQVAVLSVLALAALGAIFGPGDTTPIQQQPSVVQQKAVADTPAPVLASAPDQQAQAPTEAPAKEPDLPMGHQNALRAAQNYVAILHFSRDGLVQQLTFDGYTDAEAGFAADNCGADWNTEAAEAAQAYIDVLSFSRQGLVDQLIFDGFTADQAEHGVAAVGY